MTRTDSTQVTEILYPVLDALVEYQSNCLGLPIPDYRKPPALDPGFFAYDLGPVIEGVQNSIQGELADLLTTVGALDQWIVDQDLLMAPAQLYELGRVYDLGNPIEALLHRSKLEDIGI